VTPEPTLAYDAGVRFAVRVLNAAGIPTTESCEGGEGHVGEHPWVIVQDRRDLFLGVARLTEYGLEVRTASIEWRIDANGEPDEGARYRITLARKWPERADEQPMFLTETRPNLETTDA